MPLFGVWQRSTGINSRWNILCLSKSNFSVDQLCTAGNLVRVLCRPITWSRRLWSFSAGLAAHSDVHGHVHPGADIPHVCSSCLDVLQMQPFWKPWKANVRFELERIALGKRWRWSRRFPKVKWSKLIRWIFPKCTKLPWPWLKRLRSWHYTMQVSPTWSSWKTSTTRSSWRLAVGSKRSWNLNRSCINCVYEQTVATFFMPDWHHILHIYTLYSLIPFIASSPLELSMPSKASIWSAGHVGVPGWTVVACRCCWCRILDEGPWIVRKHLKQRLRFCVDLDAKPTLWSSRRSRFVGILQSNSLMPFPQMPEVWN